MLKNLKILTLLLVCMAFVSACSKSPEKTVTAFFDTLKSGQYEKSAEYTDIPVFQDKDMTEAKKLLDVYFNKFEYSNVKVISSDKNMATVEVELKGIDMAAVINDFLMELYTEIQTNGNAEARSDEELDNLLLSKFQSPDVPMMQIVTEVELIKATDGSSSKWVIVADEIFMAALFMEDSDSSEHEDEHYDESAFQFDVIGTQEATLVYYDTIVQNYCAFQSGDDAVYMECTDEQIEALENYKDKEVTVVFQVISNINSINNPEQASTYYILQEVK